jgi:hypothetical protein
MISAIKALLVALTTGTIVLLTGCAPVVAWRGTIHYHINEAELGATITTAPRNGDTQIEAGKEYTDAFKANTAVDTDKKPEKISKEVKAE